MCASDFLTPCGISITSLEMSETLRQLEARCAQLLIDRMEGSEVVKILQTRFRTLSSIDSAFSHVRKIVIDCGVRSPELSQTGDLPGRDPGG